LVTLCQGDSCFCDEEEQWHTVTVRKPNITASEFIEHDDDERGALETKVLLLGSLKAKKSRSGGVAEWRNDPSATYLRTKGQRSSKLQRIRKQLQSWAAAFSTEYKGTTE
jgi:hypothetical protein